MQPVGAPAPQPPATRKLEFSFLFFSPLPRETGEQESFFDDPKLQLSSFAEKDLYGGCCGDWP